MAVRQVSVDSGNCFPVGQICASNPMLAYGQKMQPEMKLITDRELLLACRSGDESAWEALVQRYQRLIYAIPRRAGLNDDQAADVFQEVFTTLFQKLDGIDQPE